MSATEFFVNFLDQCVHLSSELVPEREPVVSGNQQVTRRSGAEVF
jgi:hypothetical protein